MGHLSMILCISSDLLKTGHWTKATSHTPCGRPSLLSEPLSLKTFSEHLFSLGLCVFMCGCMHVLCVLILYFHCLVKMSNFLTSSTSQSFRCSTVFSCYPDVHGFAVPLQFSCIAASATAFCGFQSEIQTAAIPYLNSK